MVSKVTVGLVTYVGFDPANNGKRWIKERENFTYVQRQDDEFSIRYVPIIAYNSEYLRIAKERRYITPPLYLEKQINAGKTLYYFWYKKDYWVFSKEEAINHIYGIWDAEIFP